MTPEVLLAEALQIPVEDVSAKSAFGITPEWDSVAHLRLMLLIEEKLSLKLNENLMNSVSSLESLRDLFSVQPITHCDPAWEALYLAKKELNRYPHHYLVGYAFRNFSTIEARRSCRVLEVGCGAGNNVTFLAHEGFDVSGIDGAPSAIAAAKKAIAAVGLNADLVVGDFTKLPWEDCIFDLVIDRNSLTHVSETAALIAVDEILRVLKPGGRFFSMIYSDRHPALVYGKKIGSYTYENFEDGYFKDHGILNVCDLQTVQEVFGSRFEILSAKLMEEIEYLPARKIVNALWVIDARKQPDGSNR